MKFCPWTDGMAYRADNAVPMKPAAAYPRITNPPGRSSPSLLPADPQLSLAVTT